MTPNIKPKKDGGVLRVVLQMVCILVIIGIGFKVSTYFLSNKLKSKQREKREYHDIVKTEPLAIEDTAVVIEALGEVRPAQEVNLRSRVSGRVVEVSSKFIPGAHFKAGEMLLKIDHEDLDTTLSQKIEELKIIQAELLIESGRQKLAKEEVAQFNFKAEANEMALRLREPQLAIVEAKIKNLNLAIEKTKRDMARCKVKAPFDGMIETRQVNLGAEISPLIPLLHFIGTDEFWIEVSVPTHALKWIDIPGFNSEKASEVKIFDFKSWGKSFFRKGQVLKIHPQLDRGSRLARLIISVKDPYSIDNKRLPKLISNSYVNVEIVGRNIENVFRIPRNSMRQKDRIWLISQDKKLKILSPDIIYRGKEEFWIRATIEPKEKLVISRIAAPVSGMILDEVEGGEDKKL